MDIFKQNKILISLVVVLAILNILSIIGLWTIKSGKLSNVKNIYYLAYGQYQTPEGVDRLDRLAIELKFNNEQKERFKEIRNNYHNKIKVIMEEIHEVKIQILNKNLKSESDTEEIQNLFNKIGNHQAELEKNLYLQFAEIKSICNEEQLKTFENIINEMINTPKPNPYPPKID